MVNNSDNDESLFYSNIRLLIANSAMILGDADMAAAPSGVVNGSAISGPIRPATVGDYLRWWAGSKELSHDKARNPIWKLSGSGLSAGHNCKSVDSDGNSIRAELTAGFPKVLRDFCNFRKQRRDKISAKPYTLTGLIEKLQTEI